MFRESRQPTQKPNILLIFLKLYSVFFFFFLILADLKKTFIAGICEMSLSPNIKSLILNFNLE